MLSDTIFDYLYCPGSGTECDNVQHFAKELEGYSQPPFEYDQSHLNLLKTLTRDYLAQPTFVRLMTLHRSAVAFMRAEDAPGAKLAIVGGALSCPMVITI
jgi:hypothetical protein